MELGDRIIGFTFEDAAKKADKLALQLDNFDLSLFEMEELAGGAARLGSHLPSCGMASTALNTSARRMAWGSFARVNPPW